MDRNLGFAFLGLILTACSYKIGRPSSQGPAAATPVLRDYGATWDIGLEFPGEGKYSGVTTSLVAADVCSGKTLLGISGTAKCIEKSFGDLIDSMAFRLDNGTFSPSAPAGRVRATLMQEASGELLLRGNELVPNPEWDTDGWLDDAHSGLNPLRTHLEVVKGRPDIICGVSGSIEDRIQNCASLNSHRAIWEGESYGLAGEGTWKLVTLVSTAAAASVGSPCGGGLASGCFEVWRDERTLLIWSDTMQDPYNWFQAAGYANSASTVSFTEYDAIAVSPLAASGKTYAPRCQNSVGMTCQPSIPISVCADAGVLFGKNGVNSYRNPDGTAGTKNEEFSKGRMHSTDRQWRLPTIDDYQLANINGLRKVLPNARHSFWSATSYSAAKGNALVFEGTAGLVSFQPRYESAIRVRCVGR
jgi:hypothetical protein